VVACLLVLAPRSSLHVRCVALHESQTSCPASSRLVPGRQRRLSSRSSCLFLALCRSWFAAFTPVASWGRPSFVEFPRCLVFVACFLVAWILSGHQLFRNSHPSHVVRSVRCTVLWSRRSWSLHIARLVASPSALLVCHAFCWVKGATRTHSRPLCFAAFVSASSVLLFSLCCCTCPVEGRVASQQSRACFPYISVSFIEVVDSR